MSSSRSSRRTHKSESSRRSSNKDSSGPCAVKIISINEEKQSFELQEDVLREVLSKVPSNMKVSVVSVVGAFRTGKSFVLDFFLRYLHATDGRRISTDTEPDQSWMFEGGDSLEGNHNEGGSKKHRGFGWRSGRERMTTGIWVWSEHFIRKLPDTGEKVAVLLIDTQGMFDSTLGQMLTTSIFGLSTLISSYQIYNIDKRIQEDNLQHLALFTEYGRVALQQDKKQQNNDPEWYSSPDGETTGEGLRPFQRLEFLVRDWQNFEDPDDKISVIVKEMNVYLQEVLDQRNQKDLQEVRDQIHDCFEKISCFLLPFPGGKVTSKKYNGDVNDIDPAFRRLLSEYVRRVFSTRLAVKKIHGRSVSVSELFEFIKSYSKLFKEAKVFPKPKTLLAATAEANNRAGLDVALKNYRAEMDEIAGPNKGYCSESKLKHHHQVCYEAALEKYATIATIGPRGEIRRYRDLLIRDIEDRYVDYKEANRLRDPFGFVAPYIIPILVACIAYALGTVLGIVCGKSCKAPTDFLASVYITIFSFMIFHFLATSHGVTQRIKMMFTVVNMKQKLS